MMTNNSTAFPPAATAPKVVPMPIDSCASSNSGSSSAGYRHNPYNCENTLVYYGQQANTPHSQQQTQQQQVVSTRPERLQTPQLQAYLARQQQQQQQENGMSSANSSIRQSPYLGQQSPTPPVATGMDFQNASIMQQPQQQQQVPYNGTSMESSYNCSSQLQDGSSSRIQGGAPSNMLSYDQQQQDQYFTFEQRRFQAAIPVMTRQIPSGTMHTQLAGALNFALYPTVAFESLEPTVPKNQMVRMFIGQLPYNVTEMQLAWILHAFGGGANMYYFERITKTDHSKGGAKVPTGCFHCHLEQEQVGPMLQFINDRLLVDDTGIWVADTVEERNLLARYCHSMKIDKTRRFQGRPYGTVVVQVATSTFDPDTFVPARLAHQHGNSFRRNNHH